MMQGYDPHLCATVLCLISCVQVIHSFTQHVVAPPPNSLPSVLELIKENLQDKSAR